MNLTSFLSLFKPKEKKLTIPDSILIKKLKVVAKENSIGIYENMTIYHHTTSMQIPLFLLDKSRGIYLFEYKEWSYDELKNTTISKKTDKNSGSENLSYEKTHEFIKQKFNELTHSDGVKINNYLLMENLNSNEYEHLDKSFKELLPKQKVIFSDSTSEQIFQKLADATPLNNKITNEVEIIGNLLIQYLIFAPDKSMHLATFEQQNFIDSDINAIQTLCAKAKSGKTSSIISKTILEKLKNPKIKILILEPTTLACHILKQKLLNIVEYAIVEIDITSIEIITPIQLLNKHLSKLNRPRLGKVLTIDETLLNKKLNIADLIICDDSSLLPKEFINYLKQLQKKPALLLVEQKSDESATYSFSKNFIKDKVKIIYQESHPYVKAMQTISELLKSKKSSEIMVVSDEVTKKNLSEDLEFYIAPKTTVVDSDESLECQNLDNLLLCSYKDISMINAKFVILLDTDRANFNELEYALNLATDTTYILYDKMNNNIEKLKDKNV